MTIRYPLDRVTISAVMPVFNEVGVLGVIFDRVNQAIEAVGARGEIIFVDDGSTDGSSQALDALAAEYDHVKVIHLSRNFGHQPATQAGLAHATGDVVLLLDSDMQDAPEALARFIERWQAGYDVVYAVRRDRPEKLWKRCLFAGFHRLLSTVASTTIPVDAGNFSLIDARVVREIVALGERDRYLPGLRSWVGFRQTGVEVRRMPRYDGKPRVSLLGLWRLAKTAMFSFSTFPLSVFYALGLGAFGVFTALGMFSIYCKLFTNLAIPGWTSTVVVASFFGALNALGISILGDYVVRIYDQVRARPMYIIGRKVNIDEPEERKSPRSLLSAGGYDESDYRRLLEDAESMAIFAGLAALGDSNPDLRVRGRHRGADEGYEEERAQPARIAAEAEAPLRRGADVDRRTKPSSGQPQAPKGGGKPRHS